MVPKLPAWVPCHSFLACFIGTVLIVAGVAIMSRKMARLASALVGVMMLAMFALLYVPKIATNPMAGFMWTNPCKVLALLGGAILLAGVLPGEKANRLSIIVKPVEKFMFLGPLFVSLFLLVCGVQHFVYADFVDALVPAWIPPGLRFWTCFTGIALIAGGIGVMIPKTARWAAAWSGLMIFLWVLLLHIPRSLANLQKAGETSAIFEALALSGVAFLVAGTRSPRQAGRPS